MAVETEGTIGKLSFGGYPFGNVNFLSFDADTDDGSTLEINLFSSGGTAFSDLQTVDWGDGSQTGNKAIDTHTYKSASVFTVTFSAQPNFDDVVEAFMFLDRARRLDNGGGAVTALKWDSANNDFQPAPAIAFDVDVNAGDDLSLSLTRAASDPTNLGFVDGENGGVTGNSATFTYDNSGVYTAEMVAQPDFEGVTEATVKEETGNQRIGLSGADFTKLDDLILFSLQRVNLSGSLSLPTTNRYNELLLRDMGGDALDINNLPASDRHVWGINTNGDWDQFVSQKPGKILNADGSNESTKQSIGSLPDEFEELSLPSKVYLDVRAVSSSTNLDELDVNLGDTNGTFDAKDQEALTKAIGQAGRILLGKAEGRIYLEAGFDFFSSTDINSCSGYPSQSMLNNFAIGDGTYRAGFLRLYLKDNITVDGETPQNLPYVAGSSTPATKDHSSFVDALWQEGVNNGNFASDFNCRIREDSSGRQSSLYQEALNKIMGVGPQSASWHASNQGGLAERDYWEVLLGRNRTVTDYLQMNTTVTYHPSTPRLEIDMSNVNKDTNKSPTTYRSFTLDEYTNSGFAVGNDFRIYGSGFTGFDGAYRVSASSRSNEIITVEFDTSYSDPTTDLGTQETISNGSIWGQLGDNPNR